MEGYDLARTFKNIDDYDELSELDRKAVINEYVDGCDRTLFVSAWMILIGEIIFIILDCTSGFFDNKVNLINLAAEIALIIGSIGIIVFDKKRKETSEQKRFVLRVIVGVVMVVSVYGFIFTDIYVRHKAYGTFLVYFFIIHCIPHHRWEMNLLAYIAIGVFTVLTYVACVGSDIEAHLNVTLFYVAFYLSSEYYRGYMLEQLVLRRLQERTYNTDTLGMKAVGDAYIAMYFMELKKDEYIEYSAIEPIHDALGYTGRNFEASAKAVFKYRAHKDYQEGIDEFLTFSTLSERIKGKTYLNHMFYGVNMGWCEILLFPVKYDEEGELESALIGVKSIDESKRKELEYQSELEHMVKYDELTDIYTRSEFANRVSKILEENPSKKFVLTTMNIRNFRMVNELFGREKADEVLVAIANKLKQISSKYYCYGRLAADRFVLFIPEEDFDEQTIADFYKPEEDLFENSNYEMNVHIGVYHIQEISENPLDMIDKANEAVQDEDLKKEVFVYDDSVNENLVLEASVTSEISRALSDNQFKMFLQPQFDTDGDLLGAEALARWLHPERGMISPAQFIPILEKSGQIASMDMFIWETACKKLREWKEKGRDDLYISVNISPKDFYYYDIYEVFTSLVKKYDISPKNLNLEITETVVMFELTSTLELIQKLRAYGFIVELDDFGSGYSSLNTLGDFDVDVIKLDMGFLRKATSDEKNRSIMNNIIRLAKELNLKTVSEGVETEEQITYLREIGCDILQGFFYSKPISVADFERKYYV